MAKNSMSEQAWIVGSYHEHLEEVETWKVDHEIANSVCDFESELAGLIKTNRVVSLLYRGSLGKALLSQPHRWKTGKKLFHNVFEAADTTNQHYENVIREIEANGFDVAHKVEFIRSWKEIKELSAHFAAHWPSRNGEVEELRRALGDINHHRLHSLDEFINEIENSSN